MKHLQPDTRATTIGIVLFAIVIVLLIWIGMLYLKPKARVSCADFGSYAEAFAAYKQGAAWLDGNHNGIPCENLYKRSMT